MKKMKKNIRTFMSKKKYFSAVFIFTVSKYREESNAWSRFKRSRFKRGADLKEEPI